MKSVTKTMGAVWRAADLLPLRVREEIYRFADSRYDFENTVSEIRLRTCRRASLTVSGENIPLFASLTKEEMEETVKRFCEGSVYAHSDTINNGYISMDGGIRVGIVGRAVCEGGRVCAVHSISSLNIRIPHFIAGLGKELIANIKGCARAGTLIYSAPGVGKTTLLRSLSCELSKEKRVAIVDSRAEIDMGMPTGTFADVLLGYPKAQGIEIATRTLSPEYIVCDEIGADERDAILQAYSGGVPLIATVHAADFDDLFDAPSLSALCNAGIFELYVGIRRERGARDYIYDIRRRGET